METGKLEKKNTMTIMQQIEDLKNWHKQQELLFNKGNQKNVLNLSLEIPLTQNVNSKCFDEIPIKPSHSDFNHLLDSKICGNDERTESENNGLKPKKTFLRKGEGIARFKMPPQNLQYRKSKFAQIKTELGCAARTADTSNKTTVNISQSKQILVEEENLPSKLSEEAVPHSWKDLLNSMHPQNLNNSIQTDTSNHSLPESLMEKITAIGRRNARDKEEVKVFELLEQHALDSSFCSSSSVVMRLMENSIKSTPIKENQSTNEERIPFDSQEVHDLNQITENQPNQSLHVHFREKNSYSSFIDHSDSTCDENKITKKNYFDDENQWSGEEGKCECSTEYSSSDEDTRPISPPKYPVCEDQNIVTVEVKASGRNLGEIILNAVNHNEKQKEGVEINNRTLKAIENNKHVDEDTENRNELQNLKSNCGKKMKQSESQSHSSIINLRLKELEDEIEIFRKENAKLKKLQFDFEQEYKLFQNDKKAFYLQIEKEKRQHLEFMEEEKRKLTKEKLVFDKYTKNLNKNPNKEERKEIQALKEQLVAVKEELSKKESRWSVAQARVRNQVKLLEKDNKTLKEEIEVIRKQSRKVNTLKSEKKLNTHFLHAISQQLTNISAKDMVETLAAKDTSKPNERKQTGHSKVKRNQQSQKTLSNKSEYYLSSDSGNENDDVIQNKHSLETEIRKTLEEAMFEPVMETFKMKNKFPLQNCISENQNKDDEQMFKDSDKVVETGVNNASNLNQADNIFEDAINRDGNKEIHYNDGRKEIQYNNGNIKKISPNGDIIKLVYFNGDVKEISRDGKVKYYYRESQIWRTTNPDGLEVLEFPTGQIEHRHTNGMVEIFYPNKCRKRSYTDGSEEWIYKDGTVLKVNTNKEKIWILPNGQKEIHTKEHKRREYPDGTVKLIYPDGTQETRYSNGRVRLKDKEGNLIKDSG